MRNQRRWWPWPVVALLVIAAIVLVSSVLLSVGLELAGFVVGVLGLVPLLPPLIAWARRRPRPIPTGQDRVEHARRKLCEEVSGKWREEARLWRLRRG